MKLLVVLAHFPSELGAPGLDAPTSGRCLFRDPYSVVIKDQRLDANRWTYRILERSSTSEANQLVFVSSLSLVMLHSHVCLIDRDLI